MRLWCTLLRISVTVALRLGSDDASEEQALEAIHHQRSSPSEFGGSGGTAEALRYNCNIEKADWADWSQKKKEWCCRVKDIACKTWCTSLLEGPHGWSEKKKDWCCNVKQIGCQIEEFSCTSGLEEWQINWSDKKKDWCCKHKHVGCRDDGRYGEVHGGDSDRLLGSHDVPDRPRGFRTSLVDTENDAEARQEVEQADDEAHEEKEHDEDSVDHEEEARQDEAVHQEDHEDHAEDRGPLRPADSRGYGDGRVDAYNDGYGYGDGPNGPAVSTVHETHEVIDDGGYAYNYDYDPGTGAHDGRGGFADGFHGGFDAGFGAAPDGPGHAGPVAGHADDRWGGFGDSRYGYDGSVGHYGDHPSDGRRGTSAYGPGDRGRFYDGYAARDGWRGGFPDRGYVYEDFPEDRPGRDDRGYRGYDAANVNPDAWDARYDGNFRSGDFAGPYGDSPYGHGSDYRGAPAGSWDDRRGRDRHWNDHYAAPVDSQSRRHDDLGGDYWDGASNYGGYPSSDRDYADDRRAYGPLNDRAGYGDTRYYGDRYYGADGRYAGYPGDR
eukprot:TRINITY_DN123894_c0_g1_i1.p1 TRINITY_DN123894_c0_g1~~TRINITY_DN123894_c0_g1_i1.p1  ORF type:complete len:550 (-),score=60.98 TRINITY_DN123894_c0_g1_i1:186-1835(-)